MPSKTEQFPTYYGSFCLYFIIQNTTRRSKPWAHYICASKYKPYCPPVNLQLFHDIRICHRKTKTVNKFKNTPQLIWETNLFSWVSVAYDTFWWQWPYLDLNPSSKSKQRAERKKVMKTEEMLQSCNMTWGKGAVRHKIHSVIKWRGTKSVF